MSNRLQTLELPQRARAYRLATRRGEFAVVDHGTAERGTALLLPGFTGSKEDFLALLEPLADAGFRVVAVDGRGQHESDGPRDELAYGQRELARDVLAQAAALAIEGPLHLVGHSLGGLIARAAVLLDADAFASLTLMSSGPAAVAPSQQNRLRMLLGAFPTMSMEQIWAAMAQLDPPEAGSVTDSPALRAFLRRRWLATVPEQLSATARQLLAEPDRVPELAAVPLPKHVLSGEVDYAWPVELLDDMARRLDAHRTVIPGAGHSPNAEQPERTAEALAAFWRGLDG